MECGHQRVGRSRTREARTRYVHKTTDTRPRIHKPPSPPAVNAQTAGLQRADVTTAGLLRFTCGRDNRGDAQVHVRT